MVNIKNYLRRGLFLALVPVTMLTAQHVDGNLKVEKVDGRRVLEIIDTLSSSSLLADNVKVLDLLGTKKDARDEALESEISEHERLERLEFPAEDLYGEDSWGHSLNPVAHASRIPNIHKIDLTGFINPLKFHYVTSCYGMRGRGRRRRPHHGIDLKLYTGEKVYAAFDGKVRIKRYNHRGYGYYYVIRHPNGLETLYGHLSKQFVKEGEIVKAGQVIGLGGSTGRSSGPHLHFEARFMGIPINPQQLFDFSEGQPKLDEYVFRRYAPLKSSKKGQRTSAKKYYSKIKVYRIRKGDTLGSIAARYNTTVNKICRANHIHSKKRLQINSTLRIPVQKS